MVSRQDYVQLLTQVVELCTPNLRKAQEEVAQNGRVKTRDLAHMDGWFAHVCSFLHKLTGQLRYAELARDALLLAESHRGFTAAWAARAYRDIAGSAALSPAQDQAIRAGLIRTAQEHYTNLDTGPSKRWGAQPPQWNIPNIQAVGLLHIARLFPEHPDAAAWTRLATRFPEDWFERTSECGKQCHACSYCAEVLERVLVEV